MKVLLIDVNCKYSSTGKIIYDLYSYVNQRGEAAICYGRGPKINEKNIFKFGLDVETKLHALLTRFTGYTGCFSFFSTRRLISYIRKFKPDIVHIHELHAYFVNIKPLLEFLKKEKIKTVMTLHCEFAYTGKCGYSSECEKWKTECGNCPQLRNYVSTLWFDHTKKMFLQKKECFSGFEEFVVTTPSAWLSERTEDSFLKQYPIHTIYNGIDTRIFHPVDASELRKKYGIKDDQKVVLALAPNLMSARKGGKLVLQLASREKCKNIFFVLVGVDGDRHCDLENVTLEGPIYDQNLLAQYYSLANVFVICSSKENFPTTCIEAQCCGTPVYGFDTGGTVETSLAGKENFVKYGDVDALAELITVALKKEKNSSEKIARAAKEKFSRDVMCKNYERIYFQLAGGEDA